MSTVLVPSSESRVHESGGVARRLHRLTPLAFALGLIMGAGAATPAARAAESATPAGAAVQKALTLRDVVEQLRAGNRTIVSKQAEVRIAATGIERARGDLQPQASLSAVKGGNRVKNTFEEDLIRKALGRYTRDGVDYSAGVSQLFATGAKVEAKATLSRFTTNTNLADPNRPPGAFDNRTYYGFSLTQPLARDAGPEVTFARIRIAEFGLEATALAATDAETSVVAEALMAYHELTFAQDRVRAAIDRIDNADRLLRESGAMYRAGRLPLTDVLEVENARNRYQAGLSEALQFERERANRLSTMLMQNGGDSGGIVRTADPLPAVNDRLVTAEDTVRTALERRADFKMLKVTIDREQTALMYSRNQALPRVDLVGSYGLNGLEYSATEAFRLGNTSQFPTWTVGLQIAFPLGRNLPAEADIQAASIRLQEARLALRFLETQIVNDVDTAIAMRSSALERWRLWKEVHEREKVQLEAERTRFRNGRSDTREVLLREERVVNSALNVREQQLAYARAEVLLQAAQGSLLALFP